MNFRESMDRIAAQIMDERIRVVIAEPGPDGQGRGARAITPALLEAGMEIIGTSLRQTPETIVNAAPREDLRAIGLPVLPGARNAIVPETMRLLSKRGMTDVPVVSGRTVLNGNAGTLNGRAWQRCSRWTSPSRRSSHRSGRRSGKPLEYSSRFRRTASGKIEK
ncbi:MAG: cobalamin-dependent protein [Bryobacteraceae bacterium]|jgi:methylmalonyl-CoA mutase C-terminal domain/subunit